MRTLLLLALLAGCGTPPKPCIPGPVICRTLEGPGWWGTCRWWWSKR